MASDGNEAEEPDGKDTRGSKMQMDIKESEKQGEKHVPDPPEPSCSKHSVPMLLSAEELGEPLENKDKKDEQQRRKRPTKKAKQGLGSAHACESQNMQEHTQTMRIAMKWDEYVKEKTAAGEVGFALDRLAAASEYRRWVKGQQLALEPGDAVPSFTEVWLVINSKLKSSAPKAESSKQSAGRARLKAKAAPKFFSAQETLEVLAGGLKMIRVNDPEVIDFFDGSRVVDAMRRYDREFHIKRTPFSKLGDLLEVVHEDGWIELSRTKNEMTVRLLELPLNGVAHMEHLVKDWDEKASSSVRVVLAEEDQSAKKCRADDKCDVAPSHSDSDSLAEFAAETSATYDGDDSSALAPRLEECARGFLQEREEDEGREVPAPRFTLSAATRISHDESVRLLDEALRDLCEIGFPHELPISSSLLATHLWQRFRQFKISHTPFERFTDLLEAATSQGLVKLTKSSSSRRETLITWVKYNYQLQKSRRKQPSGGLPQRRRRASRSQRQESSNRHRSVHRERGRRGRSARREQRERLGERRGERRAAPARRAVQSSSKREGKNTPKKERESKKTEKNKDKDREKEKNKNERER